MAGNDAIVIGGGIFGVSAAYHLKKAGLERVLLIEREPVLAAQTSQGAAGFLAPWWAGSSNEQPELALELYGLDLYRSLAKRHQIGLRQHGIAHVATTAANQAAMRSRYELVRAQLGEDQVALLSPDQLHELAPIVEPSQVRGALFMRNAFSLVAAEAVRALADEFVALGGELRLGTDVSEIVIDDGRVRGVVAGGQAIMSGRVVVAAGAWLRRLLHTVGIELPLVATQAARFVTQPLASVPPTMPMLMFPDYHNLYLRTEQDGLLIGCEEIVVHPPTLQSDLSALQRGQLPQAVAAGVSPVADTTHHYHLWLARAFAHVVPVLGEIAVREVRVGYPTRVPDMRHVAGQAGGVHGLFLLGADLECGMTHGPGLGRIIADLAVHGHAPPEIAAYQPDRWG
ncbi:MAG: FAD-binding oxidoreductase [Roseiflexaceae bacterium]|nr:FAD-binding oxidoreductase [Roseiflexaceae bacterium]